MLTQLDVLKGKRRNFDLNLNLCKNRFWVCNEYMYVEVKILKLLESNIKQYLYNFGEDRVF